MEKLKNNIFTYTLFILSPLLSLPLIFVDMYKQRRSGVILTVLFFSLLSYYYIPYSFFDKVHYYHYYNDYLNYSFSQFIDEILEYRADYIAYFIIYVTSVIGLSFHFAAALITGISVWCYLDVFYKLAKEIKVSNKIYFISFILILFSFSYFHLLTGVRYYLGSGFIVQSLYALYKGRSIKFFLYFIIAIASHYGTIIFFPFLLVYYLFNKKEKIIKTFFVISSTFILFSREGLLSLFSGIGLGSTYTRKLEGYLGVNDFIELQLLTGSVYYLYKVKLTLYLHFIALVFLLLKIKSKSKFYLLTILMFSVGNFISSAPTVFERVTLVNNSFIFLLLLMYFISEKKINFIRMGYISISVVILLLFFLDFILLYVSYIDSYKLKDFMVLLLMFLEDVVHYGRT
ncbi:EpsG family protein [Tenacibaculum bernardetii]|uniref:EpsG family protein n=1 Tax=Tenacibaculum bernardetii TaxID=3021375 RepID=UPI0023AFBF07|nr:EpsG family protein [Tenacibaculum bernardetii]